MESSPSQRQRCLSAWPPDHRAPWHRLCNSHTLSSQTLQIHSHRYWFKVNKQNRYSYHFFFFLMQLKRSHQSRVFFWFLRTQMLSWHKSLTLPALCLVVHYWHNWHRSQCSLHTLCKPCTGPISTCACLAGTSCSSLLSPPTHPLGPHPWLWPCSQHQMLQQICPQKKKIIRSIRI